MMRRQMLALAWRESRFARRRLFLFLSAISLGVAALVAVQGFAANLSSGVRQEARGLLGADLVLGSRQAFGPLTESLLDSLTSAGVPVARRTSFASMALHARTGETRLVQVRAPEPGYPFYGEISTSPADAWEELHSGRHAVVDPALLTTLGARVGDSISLGETRFRITAVIERVPGDAEIASAFAPRVFIPADRVAETGLLAFGSRVDHDAFIRLPGPGAPERLEDAYSAVLSSERVRARTAAEEQADLEDAFGRLTSYLGLVGVMALLLGGIGVASAMAAHMAQKSEPVAVLRCLGATARQVFAVYLTQAALMGVAGAVTGVVIGLGLQWVLPGLVSGMLPIEVSVRPDTAAVVTGLGVGIWTAVVFAALPLLAIRRVSPLGALRRDVEPLRATGRDWLRMAAWAALGASAFLLVLLQVRDARQAAWMLGGLGAALGALLLASIALVRMVRKIPRRRLTYLARQGVANLHRPANQTRMVVLALGFGVFLLATLLLTQHNLLLPLRSGDAAERANLLLWDVQDDQRRPLVDLLGEQGHPVLESAPIVPMRIASIDGREVRPWGGETEADADAAERADEPAGWAVRREYRSTFRDHLTGSERVIAGSLWDPGTHDVTQVSLERDIAGDLGVALGDTIVWDVQGVMIPTAVTSIREVDWARFETNFFAVFPTATLRDAPRTWVVLTRGGSAEERVAIQRAIVERFPNIAAIDLDLVQQALDEVIGRIAAVIRFLGGFSVATGFVVLLGAVATGRMHRVRESVLLKALGATRRQIAGILLTEYLALGLLSATVGIALAAAAGWALARWVFEVPYEVQPLPLAVLAALVVGLTAATGLWASREVFRHTALEAMRAE